MHRFPLLAIPLLALVGCQASSPVPRLVGEDLFDVDFHGRVFTERMPLLPRARGVEVAPTSACSAEDTSVELRLHFFSVPRARLAETLAFQYDRKADGKRRVDRPPLIAFFFDEQALPIDAVAWVPRGMRVPRDAARRTVARLQLSENAELADGLRVAPTLEVACRPEERAVSSVVKRRSYVDRFEFKNDRNTLQWEPVIEVADSGVVLEVRSELVDDSVQLDLVLKARRVLSMPLANSKVVRAWPHGAGSSTTGLTLQSPLYSDQVFELSREFRREDAFMLLAPNTVRDDEVLVAYFEIDS